MTQGVPTLASQIVTLAPSGTAQPVSQAPAHSRFHPCNSGALRRIAVEFRPVLCRTQCPPDKAW
jgi:hypothetical protein